MKFELQLCNAGFESEIIKKYLSMVTLHKQQQQWA